MEKRIEEGIRIVRVEINRIGEIFVKVKISLVLVFLVFVFVGGCQSRTRYGDCVGLDEHQNPKLHYKVSARNLVLGIIFFELIAPPVIVVVNETYCPVGPAETEGVLK
jgi:hypothetical protein